MHSNNNVVYQHQHHPGREPSTTSASSSTSSKTSLSAAKAARSAILAEEFALARPVRVPVTRVHPHHLHHHPRFGYLYPADLEGGGNTGITGTNSINKKKTFEKKLFLVNIINTFFLLLFASNEKCSFLRNIFRNPQWYLLLR